MSSISNEMNIKKLKILIEIHDLSITDIAKLGGVSRSMVSRILSENLSGNGLWNRLEKHLPEVVSKRRKQYFETEAIPVEVVEKAGEKLKEL